LVLASLGLRLSGARGSQTINFTGDTRFARQPVQCILWYKESAQRWMVCKRVLGSCTQANGGVIDSGTGIKRYKLKREKKACSTLGRKNWGNQGRVASRKGGGGTELSLG